MVDRHVYYLQRRKVHLSPEQVSDFYKPHYGKMFFPALVAYISNAPIVALLLYKSDAISALLHLAGPTNPLQVKVFSALLKVFV